MTSYQQRHAGLADYCASSGVPVRSVFWNGSPDNDLGLASIDGEPEGHADGATIVWREEDRTVPGVRLGMFILTLLGAWWVAGMILRAVLS
jgi:hypothetical protein